MALILFLLLIVAPIVELVVFIQVASWIGLLNSLAVMLLVSLGGVLIVRHQGLGIARRVRDQVRAGKLPAADLVDGLLILIAGVLLILPGFVSDVVGLILLLPPTRAFVRGRLQKRYSVRIANRVVTTVNTVRPPRRVTNESDVVVLPPAALPPPSTPATPTSPSSPEPPRTPPTTAPPGSDQ